MSKSLTTMHGRVAQKKFLGVTDLPFFSQDGECVFLGGKITDEVYAQVEEVDKAGKVKKINGPLQSIVIVPDKELNTTLHSRVDTRRILVEFHPMLYSMGVVQGLRILEPALDKIKVYVRVDPGVTIKDIKNLDYIFRVYVLD